ncbi:hypothetical protein P280DRAFT_312872 [Massarina eburnea CBS 473.64]|uniref:Uncharacterized protein n=1 Tax=Massarina eburnea CBS 473.64 TaxID=1395130 RepID=A0A6A6S1M9_9PLEO|nr:hypothetical protein P280DRAFT_312872 [Massarina eburnea CBS 473.64]
MDISHQHLLTTIKPQQEPSPALPNHPNPLKPPIKPQEGPQTSPRIQSCCHIPKQATPTAPPGKLDSTKQLQQAIVADIRCSRGSANLKAEHESVAPREVSQHLERICGTECLEPCYHAWAKGREASFQFWVLPSGDWKGEAIKPNMSGS